MAFSSITGAAAPEVPSPHAVLAFTAAPTNLTRRVIGSDVTFPLTRSDKPLTDTKLHVADNPVPYASSEPSPTPPVSSSSATSSVVFGPYSHSGLSFGSFFSGAVRMPLSQTLFNATASFLGVPGLVSPVDGVQDEGLGFHADGTTRKAGGSDDTSNFSGQRAAAYASSASSSWALGRQDWLYDDIMDIRRDAEGRALYFGSDMSGRRDNRGSGHNLFGDGGGMFGNSLLQRGLSAGMGFANTSMESAILGLMGKDSPYGNGKARLNFMWHLDDKGKSRFGGEGDVLWPLYDSLHTTIYTQFGARSMYGGGSEYGPDRWIGNVGIGQRWFPAARIVHADRTSAAPQGSAAEQAQDRALGRSGASDRSSPTGRGGERHLGADGKVDSGNWMLGYNAFYDHDITRGHQRGGVGVEAQYDWLKVAANYYVPLSSWKDSKDFDGNYVRERAAEGWDVRVKGYVPFYREVAVTGSFTQWYGDYVGMFGPSKLEKDPKVWSYGLEYTPVPALTAYVNQRQSERGRSDTEFGLRFTYHFGMDAKDQFKPSRVAEMRTVHGSRHDFVDRENKIILEYKAKNSLYIDFVSYTNDAFIFRIRDGFNKNKVGQTVRVLAGGYVTIAQAPVQSLPIQSQTLFAQALDALSNFFAATFSVSLAHADSGKQYITDSGGLIYVRVDDVNKLTHLQVSAGEVVRMYDRPALTLPPAPEITLTAEKTSLPNDTTTSLTLTNALMNSAVIWTVEGVGGPVTGGSKTDANGTATATFTASGMGTATVTATAGKESASTVLTITAAAYTLEATPDTLKQYEAKSVTFTVKKNTVALANTYVTLKGAGFTGLPLTQTTNGSGQIIVNLTATATGAQTVELEVGGSTVASKNITVTGPIYSLAFGTITGTGSTFTNKQTADIPVKLLQDGVAYTGAAQTVTWSIVSADNSTNQAVPSTRTNKATGLAWGASATSFAGTELAATTTSTTNGSGNATIQLTDIMGERTVTVRASVSVEGKTVTQDQPVTFGAGPLAKFKAPLSGTYKWSTDYPVTASTTDFPAAKACDGTVSYIGNGYYVSSKLSSQAELKAVASGAVGNNAWTAAGWPDNTYWTGEVVDGGNNAVVVDVAGNDVWDVVRYVNPVVCLR